MNDEQVRRLLENYRSGTLTDHERAILESWYAAQVAEASPTLDDEALRHNLDVVRGKVVKRTKPRVHQLPYRWVAAAAVLLVAAAAWFFVRNGAADGRPVQEVAYEVLPGGNKATLTLADGRKVALSTSRDGIVVAQDGITYSDGSTVIAGAANQGPTAEAPAILSMTTPRGGTYRIMLADGTTVWLNAGSTLRYPVQFDPKERIVELEGEAYFEVQKTKGKRIPFVVKSKGQDISVLGTEFNVSAYADEQTVRTVLVNGSVKVLAHDAKGEVLLQPGEESVLSSEGIHKRQANIASVTAWKAGKFRFDDTELHDIMNQLSRWYDLEVQYRGEIKDKYFYGVMNRDQPLSDVLDVLHAGGVNFKVEQLDDGSAKLFVLP